MHTSYYLRYLKRKQTVDPLPTTPENVTALPCQMWGLLGGTTVTVLWSEIMGGYNTPDTMVET